MDKEIRARPTLKEWCKENKDIFFHLYIEGKKCPVYMGNGFMALFLSIFYLNNFISCIEYVEDQINIYCED